MKVDHLIISVSKAKQKDKYIVIFDDGEYLFSEDTLVKYKLFKDSSFTEEQIKEIKAYEDRNVYFNKTLNYISFQMRTKNEIIDYLIKFKLNEEEISSFINKLININMINDELLAKLLFDSSVNNFKGPYALEKKMKERKFDNDLIRLTINMFTEEIQENLLDEIIKAYLNKHKDYPFKKQKQLLYDKLYRDGFSLNIVSSRINFLEVYDDSTELLEKEINKLLKKYEDLDKNKRKQKIISSLVSKGFEYNKIIQALSSLDT